MVLLTGGTGFLGAYIIKNLVEKGVAVRAIRRSDTTPFFMAKEISDAVEWMNGDVLDVVSLEEAMQGVKAVIHSAAVVSFHQRLRQQMYQTNIEGTANVVNAAIENGVPRLLHISSVAAIGRTSKNEKVSEEKKWEDVKSNTHYALSKRLAEMEVWRGFAEGLQGAILNPSTILGFGDWHQSSCAIFKSAYKSFPWYTTGVNGFVGVEDVAEAAVQILQSEVHQKRFIVSAGNWSFQQLLNSMADGFGKPHPHRLATPFLGELAWRIEGMKSLFRDGKPLLTKESARVAHSKTEFDNSALLKVLPTFTYTPLEKVIQDACEKYTGAINNGQLTL